MRGSVIKRGATWSVVIDLGRDTTGRRQRRWHSGFRTKKDAERARIELLGSVDRGTYVSPTKLTLERFLVDEWLPAKRATVKQTTLASYEMHVLKHIVPRIGHIGLSSLGAAHLNAFYAELLVDGRRDGRGGLSPTTVRLIHATVHKALEDSVRWGRLARNAAHYADPPKSSQAEMTIWTPAQVKEFLDSVRHDRMYAAWLLAATTGMRRGEVLGLRWADVDLDSGRLTVRQIRTVAQYRVVTSTPKTDKGTRTVSIDAATVAALRDHRAAQHSVRVGRDGTFHDTGDLVFVHEDGSMIHPERLSSWFAQLCRRSGLPQIRLHDVRHSYVTALIGAGVPVKVVSRRVGHSSPMVTMTIYQHVLPGDDQAAADLGAKVILGDV